MALDPADSGIAMLEELVASVRARKPKGDGQMPVLLLLDSPAHSNPHRKVPREAKMADIVCDVLRCGLLEFDLPTAHSMRLMRCSL